MLTDQFLNICCSCCLSDRLELQGDLPESIVTILAAYQSAIKSDDIPIDIRKKFELVQTIAKLKIGGGTSHSIIDSIISSKKYTGFESYLNLYSSKGLTESEALDYKKHIAVKRKFSVVSKEFDKLSTFVEDYNSNAFDDLAQALDKYDELISKLYIDLNEEKRRDGVTKVSSLDLLNDEYDSVIDQLTVNNSGDNTVPTGYKELDKFMKKGYNPTRLYIIGGSSGDGKSTFLVNNLVNAVEQDAKDPDGLTNIYAYATLENLVDESLLRLYCAWKDIEPEKVIENIDVERNEIGRFIKDKCRKNNATIQMQYFTPTSISPFGIRHWIQTIKDKYKGKGRLRAVYVDYLDLLKSDKSFDVYRLELGQITLLLKAVAVLENIPIITVTQLNREGYDKEVFSLTTMSESIKKVDHADFIGILHNLDEQEPVGGYHQLEFFIGKNRNGPKNKKVVLRSKFAHFIIKDGMKGAGLTFEEGVKRTSISYTGGDVIMDGFV